MDKFPYIYMIYQKAMAFLNNKIVSFKKEKVLKQEHQKSYLK